uniref:PDZ domain-containing protein n=1 Tax=Panagrellus redivivus TaxID=6233 RepID=A0A7E4V4S7_PANRE
MTAHLQHARPSDAAMESPVANASSSDAVGGGPDVQGRPLMAPSSSNSVPSPAPPLFANPFLAPFLPQGTSVNPDQSAMAARQQHLQQLAAAAAAQSSSVSPNGEPPVPDYRVNPFSGGLFVSPNQYQEFMQQYFHGLMAQAAANQVTSPSTSVFGSSANLEAMATSPRRENYANGTTNGPSDTQGPSPSPPLAVNDPASAVLSGLATLNLGQLNLGSPTTAPTPPIPMMGTAGANPTTSRQSTPSKVSTASASVGIASGASTNCSSSPSPSFGLMNGVANDQEKDAAMATPEQPATSEVKPADATPEAPEIPAESAKEATPAPSTTQNASGDSSETDEKPKRKFDARADELFRKQMNEIEQEINRRIQNRHVRKLNEEELSQLLNETGYTSYVEAGKPTQSVSEQMGHLIRDPSPPPAAPKNPTLNQLRSSFSPPDKVLGAEDFEPTPVASSSTQPMPSYMFPFGNVQMAQPPAEPANAPFIMGGNSTMTSVAPAQTQAAAASTYIPGLDPPPAPAPQPAPAAPASASNVLPNPNEITPEMAAMLLKQIQQTNPQLLSSLGLVPASSTASAPKEPSIEAFRLPAPPTVQAPSRRLQAAAAAASASAATTSTEPSASASIPDAAGGWQQLNHSAPTGTSASTTGLNGGTTTGLDNNKENATGQEPIWVMRDSYLKRLQREEQRSKEAANGVASGSGGALNGTPADDDEEETDKLLNKDHNADIEEQIRSSAAAKKPSAAKKEVMVHEPAVLIEGVLFRARYLGSTQLTCDGRPTKSSRMAQAQEAVARVKAPEGEIQPSTEIDLFISTEKIMVLNTDLQDILMDHALRSISYIADIGDVVVLMARRMPNSGSSSSDSEDCEIRRTPRVVCHVFESDEASFIAQSIGQAFQVAYVEFLRANGIDDPAYLREIDYQEVLNSQELLGEELDLFAKKETQKDVVVRKRVGEPLGLVVVESGWGSMLPTVVIAAMEPGAPATRSNEINIGDQIIAINGISLVGLPLAKAQQNIKNAKVCTAVRLTVVSTPPVVEVRIKRPDTKYQLGFSVQNGVICSLLRGGIAERGGIRVGHRIIEINHKSAVNIPHEKIVNMLATATGEIHMKTMPTSMYRLLTGQEVPTYI